MYDMPQYIPQGWQCPVCKRVYAPDWPFCTVCGNTDTFTTTEPYCIGYASETMKQPTTGGKCSCWHENDYGKERCWGTKEREVCDCGGDKRKCNFYQEFTEKIMGGKQHDGRSDQPESGT